jgi:hypothetical protein
MMRGCLCRAGGSRRHMPMKMKYLPSCALRRIESPSFLDANSHHSLPDPALDAALLPFCEERGGSRGGEALQLSAQCSETD